MTRYPSRQRQQIMMVVERRMIFNKKASTAFLRRQHNYPPTHLHHDSLRASNYAATVVWGPSVVGSVAATILAGSCYYCWGYFDLSFLMNPTMRTHYYEAPATTPPTRVLAHSASVVVENDRLLSRIAQWLQAVFRSFQDTIFVTMRGTEIVLRLSPLLLLTPASILAARIQGGPDGTTTGVADWAWRYTRYSITALGPAFVKLFQWVATRRDIVPAHVCDRLSVLHDRGIPHAWKSTDVTLQQAFGKDYEQRGLYVDNKALIGCGSAAQVYRGTLVTDNGVSHSVAVKVLHPRMAERVTRDMQFVQTVADFLHSLPFERIQVLNLPRAVTNFGTILLLQADLRVEADNLSRFRKNFYGKNDDEQNSAILFPKPMEGWIGKNVLVEDLVDDATPISEYLKDSTEEGVKLRKELASPMLRAFLKMVFLDNFVHCDLHAGNVLIQTSIVERSSNLWDSFFWRTSNSDDNAGRAKETKRQIVFLDAGIATSLNPNDQRNLHDLFRAVILNEGDQAGRLMVERARYERCSQTPGGVDAFARGVEDLVSEFHVRRKEGLTLGAVRIGSLLSRVLDLCRIHHVEIDPGMASIVISTLVLEGLGRSLEPELNLIDFAVPFVLGRGRV